MYAATHQDHVYHACGEACKGSFSPYELIGVAIGFGFIVLLAWWAQRA